MLVKSTAILLKKVKYGEKDLILQTYTLEEGNQAFFMASSSKRGKLKTQLPSLGLVDIVAHKGRGSLPRVRELQLREKHFDLLSNVHKSAIVMFLNEILLKTLKEYHADEDLFAFMESSLNLLDRSAFSNANFHLKFLLDLSQHLGFYPNGQYSEAKPFFDLHEGSFVTEALSGMSLGQDLSQRLHQVLECDLESCHEVKLSRQERKELLSKLVDYYRIHVEKFDGLQSLEILETVLS